MIITFNEEIIRQCPKSSFRDIFCLDFVLRPLFPRNIYWGHWGQEKQNANTRKQAKEIPARDLFSYASIKVSKSWTSSLFALWPEYISSSSSSLSVGSGILSVNFRFQKTFPAKYTVQAHGIVTWANRMRATKTGTPCSKLHFFLFCVMCVIYRAYFRLFGGW